MSVHPLDYGNPIPGPKAAPRPLCCDRTVQQLAPPGTLRRDILLAVGALAVGAMLLALGGFFELPVPGRHLPRAWFALPLVALCVALGLRRVAPLTALALGTTALGADVALGGSIANILIFTQVLYEACVHGPSWLWRWVLGASVAITSLATAVGMIVVGSWRGAAVGVPFALVFLLTTVTAISVRQYRDQAAAERARAEQTARLAELDRAQAVTAERNRMARELHDVIANHLSAIAIHASALLSVRDLDPASSGTALRVIRDNSVRGLAEMRAMVELLRDPAGSPSIVDQATRPRLADVTALVDSYRTAGLTVRLEVTGKPRALPVSVDLAAYRILQESLTNALKHGAGPADVRVEYGDSSVILEVTNPLSERPTEVPGSGSGVIGMRERAELLGGDLTAEPRDDRWSVRAVLPMTEANP